MDTTYFSYGTRHFSVQAWLDFSMKYLKATAMSICKARSDQLPSAASMIGQRIGASGSNPIGYQLHREPVTTPGTHRDGSVLVYQHPQRINKRESLITPKLQVLRRTSSYSGAVLHRAGHPTIKPLSRCRQLPFARLCRHAVNCKSLASSYQGLRPFISFS